MGEVTLGEVSYSQCLNFPATLILPYGTNLSVSAFVDSGFAGNFIHSSLVTKHQISVIQLEKLLSVSSINDEVLPGPVQFCLVPLSLHIGALHQDNISFYVLPKSTCTLLLGLPWLCIHAPVIDWSSGEVIRWGKQCITSCMSVPHISSATQVSPSRLFLGSQLLMQTLQTSSARNRQNHCLLAGLTTARLICFLVLFLFGGGFTPYLYLRLKQCLHTSRRIWKRDLSTSHFPQLVQDSSLLRKKMALCGPASTTED